MAKIALITGANRGLGFETARQLSRLGYHVILTARNAGRGERAAETLKEEGSTIDFHPLDVTDDQSVRVLAAWVKKTYGKLHVLVNNAGVLLDGEDDSPLDALHAKVDTIKQTLDTNTYGAFRMIQAFAPLLKASGEGRVVNVSSGMGQLSEMNGGYPAYRISKTALNAVTRIFSEELPEVKVNSVCPGWVKTDMGGPGAELTPEEGVQTIVWAATLPANGPSGDYFREKERIDW